MDPILFLTHEQVCELTGAGNKAGQIANLKANGIRHTIKKNGWPSVTLAAVIGGAPEPAQKQAWSPKKAV